MRFSATTILGINQYTIEKNPSPHRIWRQAVTFFRSLPRLATRLIIGSFALWLLSGSTTLAGEAHIANAALHAGHFQIAGQETRAWNLLFYAAFVITATLRISVYPR